VVAAAVPSGGCLSFEVAVDRRTTASPGCPDNLRSLRKLFGEQLKAKKTNLWQKQRCEVAMGKQSDFADVGDFFPEVKGVLRLRLEGVYGEKEMGWLAYAQDDSIL